MEPPSPCAILISNATSRRTPRAAVRRAVNAALARRPIPLSTVSVHLTSDAELRELNAAYRGISEPTDVLSFLSEVPGAPSVGDLAISLDTAERQAEARGVSLTEEVAFLAIHGTLHLLGLDDETEADRAEMLREMNAAARAAGFREDPDWASLPHEVAPC